MKFEDKPEVSGRPHLLGSAIRPQPDGTTELDLGFRLEAALHPNLSHEGLPQMTAPTFEHPGIPNDPEDIGVFTEDAISYEEALEATLGETSDDFIELDRAAEEAKAQRNGENNNA